MTKLSDLEAKTLTAWERTGIDDNVLSFDVVSRLSGTPRHKVRRVVRALARKGMVEFSQSSWDTEGKMCGAGYMATEAGYEALDAMESAAA